MMNYTSDAAAVISQVKEAVVGKADVIEQIMMAILAKGHVLIEDIPGLGKTTMALAFSKAMGLKVNRVQFTPDVLPSDLTGFNVYRKETGEFVYQPGAVMCNLLLADEINRTSPKTQAALLEVMEERQVTVDGKTRKLDDPFVVIATENPAGSAGTQLLPESQLDRFMVCVKMGYPTEKEEITILKRNHAGRSTDSVQNVTSAEKIMIMQQEVEEIYMHDRIYSYIARLSKATREQEMIEVGLSPRGSVALSAMSKASAYLHNRGYVIPDDVVSVFASVASHRIQLSTKAKVARVQISELLTQILGEVSSPNIREM